jgi:hypothetical protein
MVKSRIQSRPARKDPLEFNEAYAAFLGVFSMPLRKKMSRELAIKLLNEGGLKAEWNATCADNFEIYENFLLPHDISRQYFRVKLDDIDVYLAAANEQITRVPLSAEVFLAIYPEIKVGILMLNIRLGRCDVDQLIYFKQSFFGRFKLDVALPASLGGAQRRISLNEVVQNYAKSILSSFSIATTDLVVMPFACIEIRSLSDTNDSNDPEDVFQNFPQQIYGLLVADEGWRYVPLEVARSRIEPRWGTRDFVKVACFAESVVMMNFEDKSGCKYKEDQRDVRERFGCEVEKYFVSSSEVAGLRHGPLLMLENVSIQRFVVQQALARTTDTKTKKIKKILNERERLSEALAKLSPMKIPEVGSLGYRIQEAMHVSSSTEELKKRLEEVEQILLIRYAQRKDILLTSLSVVAFGISIVSFMMSLL